MDGWRLSTKKGNSFQSIRPLLSINLDPHENLYAHPRIRFLLDKLKDRLRNPYKISIQLFTCPVNIADPPRRRKLIFPQQRLLRSMPKLQERLQLVLRGLESLHHRIQVIQRILITVPVTRLENLNLRDRH